MVRLGSGSGDMKELAPDAIDRGIDALEPLPPGRRQSTSADDPRGRDQRGARGREPRRLPRPARATRRASRSRSSPASRRPASSTSACCRPCPCSTSGICSSTSAAAAPSSSSASGATMLAARSLKLGAIRLTERFFGGEPCTAGASTTAAQFVRAYLRPVAREIVRRRLRGGRRQLGHDRQRSREMAQAQRGGEPGRCDRATSRSPPTELARRGQGAARRRAPSRSALESPASTRSGPTSSSAGALILEQAFAQLAHRRDDRRPTTRCARASCSTRCSGADAASLHHLRDLRYESVRAPGASVPERARATSTHAAELALELFDADRRRCHRPRRATTASSSRRPPCCANVGLFVSHDRHHMHSYYVIRNTDHLAGFTDDEIELIALVARYHRKCTPKPSHAEFAALTSTTRTCVRDARRHPPRRHRARPHATGRVTSMMCAARSTRPRSPFSPRSTPMPTRRSRSTPADRRARRCSRNRSAWWSTSRIQGVRMTDDIAWLDAAAQAELVRTGQVTPGELVEGAINHIEKLDPEINPVIHPLVRQGAAPPRQSASELPDGPFRGVPSCQGPGRRGRPAAQRHAGDPPRRR